MTSKLEESNEKNIFAELARELRKHYELEQLLSWVRFLTSFRMTQKFLIEIWDRVRDDIRLRHEYWEIYTELYDPGSEGRKPTHKEVEILDRYNKHWILLNLDIEDWFLHAHILMEKFGRLARETMVLLSTGEEKVKPICGVNPRSFKAHIEFFATGKGRDYDAKYAEMLRTISSWYCADLKDIRDDLIQHETTARLWSTSVSPDGVRVSRFVHSQRLLKQLYDLRDKNIGSFPFLKNETNFFKLLEVFEKSTSKMDKGDVEKIKGIRKTYGKDFPDIPELYSKMNRLFRETNDHFILRAQERFKGKKK
jgi:hypothetical protein